MDTLNLTTKLLGIEDPNITIEDIFDCGNHKEIMAKLDYDASECPSCGEMMGKYDFQKASKIPYLDCAGYKTLIRLRKRRFRCSACHKMLVAETSLVKKNHQIPRIVNQKIAQKLVEKRSMTSIAEDMGVSVSSVIRKLDEFSFTPNWNKLPTNMSWDEFAARKGKMSFVAQDFDTNEVIAILDGRTHTIIRNHFLRYPRQVREQVQIVTMDMYSPYYSLVKFLFPNAQIVLDRFHIVQHLTRAMNRTRIQIMNQFDRKSEQYRALKRYWKLIQQDSRKLSDKRFYRPMFKKHLTNREIRDLLLDFSEEIRYYYDLYQLLLFHFQEKNTDHFFDVIDDHIKKVNPIFQTVLKTFKKNKQKVINAMTLPYSNAKLEATNNLIKVIKRNAYGFRNFENFKTRILIALNIKRETKRIILSRC